MKKIYTIDSAKFFFQEITAMGFQPSEDPVAWLSNFSQEVEVQVSLIGNFKVKVTCKTGNSELFFVSQPQPNEKTSLEVAEEVCEKLCNAEEIWF